MRICHQISLTTSRFKKIETELKQRHHGRPPRRGVVGFSTPVTLKISEIRRVESTNCQPEFVRADVLHITNAQALVNHWLSYRVQLHSRLRLSQLFIYEFTSVHGFRAASCNLKVTIVDAHWAELIRAQHWQV